MRNTWSSDVGFFVSGLALGGAVALLFAPRSGEETRAQIREGMDRGTEALKRKSDEMMTQASDALRMGREAVQTGTDRLRTEARRLDAAYQAGKEAYHQHPAEA